MNTARGNLPVTVFGVAMALLRNPEAVAAMLAAGWEIASHGYRWIDYQAVDEATERDHLPAACHRNSYPRYGYAATRLVPRTLQSAEPSARGARGRVHLQR
jgi:peptidoglycan/xylan/chitin deacetylase (PgdA/CDA1 family)